MPCLPELSFRPCNTTFDFAVARFTECVFASFRDDEGIALLFQALLSPTFVWNGKVLNARVLTCSQVTRSMGKVSKLCLRAGTWGATRTFDCVWGNRHELLGQATIKMPALALRLAAHFAVRNEVTLSGMLRLTDERSIAGEALEDLRLISGSERVEAVRDVFDSISIQNFDGPDTL
jgi:hypothetical protein